MLKPSVSVILPVFNCERYLGEAIESLFAQGHSNLQVIVIDDGSEDGSRNVVASFGDRIEYAYQENSGIGAARNHGLQLAKGDYIAFIDSDDRWADAKLERQLGAFREDPDLDLVFGHVAQFISPELDAEQKAKIACPPEPMPGYLPYAMLGRRESVSRMGDFETGIRGGEFFGWFARAREIGLRTKMLQDVVYWRRLHDQNITVLDRDQTRSAYLHALKAIIDRKRKLE